MKQYKYVAVNLTKEKYKGIFLAENEEDLRRQLNKQGLFLVSAKLYKDSTPSAFFTLGTGKVSLGELTVFCRQFAIMIESGISVLDCMECLKGQPYSGYFKKILEMVYDDVKTGVMLSDAFNKHAKVFPDFFRSMIKVGEISGKIDTVFVSLADYYERDASTKRKVMGALSYPLMLVFMTVAIVILMLLYVVPTFRDALSSLDVEISGLTAAIYSISDFLLANWLYMLAIAVVIALILFMVYRTKKGRYAFDWLALNFPFIKTIQINIITARFARSFGLLLSSGMDLADAMDSVIIILGNKDLEARFKKAAEDVRHGITMTNAFEHYKLFPQMLLQMISIGENTASIDDVLNRSCHFFDEQVETSLNSITSKIQPVLLLVMGLVIGTLFLAVYSPMISIMTGLL